MNLYCRRAGLDEAMDAPVADRDMIDQLVALPLETGDVLGAVTAAASCYRTGDWPLCVEALRKADSRLRACKLPPMAERIEAFIPTLWDEMEAAGDPQWADALGVARKLCEFAGSPDGDESESGDGSPGDGDGDGDPVPIDLSTDDLDRLIDEKLAADDLKRHPAPVDPVEEGLTEVERCRLYSRGIRGYAIGWDNMEIVEVPKPKRLIPSRLKGKAPTPTDHGLVPKHMDRFCTDKMVFAGRGKRRMNGGAVVIDCSGSMSLTDRDIDRLLVEAPAGIVATYAGQRPKGFIHVIVRNGKRAIKNLRPKAMGNYCDVEALEWLGKQKDRHRYWVCDGMVSGSDTKDVSKSSVAESFGSAVCDRCIELCREHRIERVDSIDALVAAMRRDAR